MHLNDILTTFGTPKRHTGDFSSPVRHFKTVYSRCPHSNSISGGISSSGFVCMKLISQYDDGNELLKKTDVMALYQYEHAIGIGDSFTDMKMSQAVDTVFARDLLAKYLDKLGKPYFPYETFYDVTEVIRERFRP